MTATIVIAVVAVLVVGWLAFLVASSIRNRSSGDVPRNVAPGKTDDELESKRLEKVQAAAVVLTGFLAFYLPIYYLGEQDRQAGFVEQFDEESLERGAEVVASVGCTDCHGADWSGGGASYVEQRSGINVNWAAPALNDVFFRYNDEEIRYWIVYGRANTPMPAWGTEGGGPLDQQQISDVINYLSTQQIDQQAALAKIDPSVDLQLQRLNQADRSVDQAIVDQEQLLADIAAAPGRAPAALDAATRAAELVEVGGEGVDADGDGLSDTAETELVQIVDETRAAFVPEGLLVETLDPESPESVEGTPGRRNRRSDGGVARAGGRRGSRTASAGGGRRNRPRRGWRWRGSRRRRTLGCCGGPHLVAAGTGSATARADRASRRRIGPPEPADRWLAAGYRRGPPSGERPRIAGHLARRVRSQPRTTHRTDAAGSRLPSQRRRRRRPGRLMSRPWPRRPSKATWMQASRAVGLFNAYCARCHTSDWSAGVPFTLQAGAGGLGPALWNNRPNVQFTDEADMIDFLITGSEANIGYGVNGMGTGRMPGFGQVLQQEDIELITRYLRGPTLTGR